MSLIYCTLICAGATDFDANLGQLQFVYNQMGQRSACVTLSVFDDDDVEDSEEFYLVLRLIAGLSTAVDFVSEVTRVVIIDDDGMCCDHMMQLTACV